MTVWLRPSSPLILTISLTMMVVVGSLQGDESQPIVPSPLGCKFSREEDIIECHDTTLDNVIHAFKILSSFINTSHEPRSIAIKDCEIPYLPYVFPKFNKSLERVHLVHSQLEYVYPDAFAHLQMKLRYLDFSHNKLHSVPYAFSTLLSLEILNLQYNQIVFIWPGPQFLWMFGLRELNLAYNHIGLSSDYVPDVRRVIIKEPIVDHPYQLAQNLTLEEFNIEPISSSLEVLNLSGNKLATLPFQLYRRRLPNLRTLDLSNNLLSELPKITSRVLPKIRRLNLRSNFIQSLGFYSLPINLHELDLSENPLRCDCDILWLQEWVDSNKTVIFLPNCNSPSDLKGQFVLQLTNASLCGERNETLTISDKPEKFGDFELFYLSSTPNTIKVLWRAKVNGKNDKKWKVFYRQSIDSRYKMTLNYSEHETSYVINNSTNSSKPWAYTTYVSEINNLEPNTYYIICISVSSFASFFIQPEKCQAIQTSDIVSQTSTIRVVKTESVKTKQKFQIKTILTDIKIYPKSITLKWDIVLLPRVKRSILFHNTPEEGSFNFLKWIVQVRKFASFNITETEISVDQNEAQSNRSFEYTIVNLTPSTGYDLCVQAINTTLVDGTGKMFPDIDFPLMFQSSYKENKEILTSTCKEVVTSEEKIFPVTEVAIATTVSTSTSAVVVAVFFFCCPKSFFKCKPEKVKEKASVNDNASHKNKKHKSFKKLLAKSNNAPSGHFYLEGKDRTERNISFNVLREPFENSDTDEYFLRQQLNLRSLDLSQQHFRDPSCGSLERNGTEEKKKTSSVDNVGYLTPKVPQQTKTNYITLQHSDNSEGYSTFKNGSMRSFTVYNDPEKTQYIGGQNIQVLAQGSRTLPRPPEVPSANGSFLFHSRYSLPHCYRPKRGTSSSESGFQGNKTDWPKGGAAVYHKSCSESGMQGYKSPDSIERGKLWFRSYSLSDSTSGMGSQLSSHGSERSLFDDVFIDLETHFAASTIPRDNFEPKISIDQSYCIEHV